MQLTLALIGIGLCIGLLLWSALSQAEEKSVIRSSLRQLDGYEVENVRDSELLAPVTERAIAPTMARITGLGKRFTPVGYADTVRHKLTSLGRGDQETYDKFLVIRVITIALTPVWLIGALIWVPFSGFLLWATVGLGIFILVVGPDAMLNRRVEERQHQIRIALPDVLDLLVISVEAGLGFEQALDRTVAAVPGPLTDEFARMLGEVRAGSSRADAMRALDQRVDVVELRSFVLAILQADTFGVSIGRVLRSQADEMRVKRRQIAQEQAQKAPVKMLIPMVFCIFPALFVIVLGPAVINIYENFT
ncbi:MAG TPA: type II secretion system F family protein [Acidimicrobiales bacterium]|nr:type II secretion system F family protein [Acidimicrobiales bacterium]